MTSLRGRVWWVLIPDSSQVTVGDLAKHLRATTGFLVCLGSLEEPLFPGPALVGPSAFVQSHHIIERVGPYRPRPERDDASFVGDLTLGAFRAQIRLSCHSAG